MALADIQRLPVEILTEVFSYLPNEEVCTLGNECTLFQKAMCLHMKSSLLGLRNRIHNQLYWAVLRLKEFPMNHDHPRLVITKSLTFMSILATELDILHKKIWRYSKSVEAWTELCQFLGPILDQFDRVITNTVNFDERRCELNSFGLNRFYSFLNFFEDELEDEISLLANETIPFEIKAIDILCCCPSSNFQLGLKKLLQDRTSHNIYAYFKIPSLKRISQVPDVHNSLLTNDQKKKKILKYLRESVQWENVEFLSRLNCELSELEMDLLLFHLPNDERQNLINKLKNSYSNLQKTLYEPVRSAMDIIEDHYGFVWNEFYYRMSSYSMSMTDIICIVDLPNQKYLPLVLQTLRGRCPLRDHIKTIETDVKINFENVGTPFSMEESARNSTGKCSSLFRWSDVKNEKPKFQLIIHFREGFNSSPAEAIINLSYSEQNECNLTFHKIQSEPFDRNENESL